MRQECRKRFPATYFRGKPLISDPGMHHATCVTHVPWCMSGSLTGGGGENVPGFPGACATRNFMYLARAPCTESLFSLYLAGRLGLWLLHYIDPSRKRLIGFVTQSDKTFMNITALTHYTLHKCNHLWINYFIKLHVNTDIWRLILVTYMI